MTLTFQVGKTPVDERSPLRVLVLADLRASTRVTEPTTIADAEGFAQLLQRLAPRLLLAVPNCLGQTPATLELHLEVTSLRDFAPQSLAQRLPHVAAAQRLLEQLRPFVAGDKPLDQLSAMISPHESGPLSGLVAVCREALGAEAAPAPVASVPADAGAQDASIDHILEMVKTPTAEERATAAIGSIIGAVGRGKRPASSSPLRAAIERSAELIGRQLDAVLHHGELQTAEAAWRGLRLLVERTDFRRQIQLQVMHLPRLTVDDPLLRAVLEGGGYDLILAPLELKDPTVDVEALQWLAEQAEALQAPVVFSVGAGFFGLTDGAEAAELRYPGTLLERPQYTAWNALRDKDCSRWLAAVFNRFLLRLPEADETSGAPRESALQSADYLWGDPVWLVGCLVTRSFAEKGWPTEIAGTTGGRIDDLLIRPLRLLGRGEVQSPLEACLSQQLCQDLARAGFISFFSPENNDTAFALYTPTVFRQPEDQERKARVIALPYQLLAARIAQAVSRFKPQLAGSSSVEETRTRLGRFVQELIADTGAGAFVDVQLRPDGEHADQQVASLELRTGKAVLGGIGVELAFTIAH
jgi:type VI secretion system protein ImpC